MISVFCGGPCTVYLKIAFLSGGPKKIIESWAESTFGFVVVVVVVYMWYIIKVILRSRGGHKKHP
jgi:hypothetical protein